MACADFRKWQTIMEAKKGMWEYRARAVLWSHDSFTSTLLTQCYAQLLKVRFWPTRHTDTTCQRQQRVSWPWNGGRTWQKSSLSSLLVQPSKLQISLAFSPPCSLLLSAWHKRLSPVQHSLSNSWDLYKFKVYAEQMKFECSGPFEIPFFKHKIGVAQCRFFINIKWSILEHLA